MLDAEVYRFRVGPGDGRCRLDLYLHRVFKGRSRSYWKRMVERGAVEIEGRSPRGASRVGPGDRIAIQLDRLGRSGRRPPELPEPSYEVVHEDAALLAVNKRAGAFCHPVGRLHSRSLISDLRRDRGEAGTCLRLCHRLDRFVSGLTLLAKGPEAAGLLGAQFEDRAVEKTYLALVHGEVGADEGRITLPVGRAAGHVIRIRMGVDTDGKPAVTNYTVVRRAGGYTLVQLRPETGRRHQLRLHLAEIGHPIVNDPLYGRVVDVDYYERQTFDNHDDPDDSRRWIALHAWRLVFTHPVTGALTTLEAPIRGPFARLLDALGQRELARQGER
jgi:23S rRNA pseudouridine1911/1915/1917 synthase